MFRLFKKKTKAEVLQQKYKKLLKDAHRLSTANRKLSDDKAYEADQVLKQMEKLA